uniref:DDHD domain-containing protein n=1 Tax=Auxenochlorella protothecoides TaxID=3075 RepID=A0A1D2AB48_AUXPR
MAQSQLVVDQMLGHQFRELEPAQVRWYSHRADYSPSSLASNPEVVHRGSVLRYNDLDSLALERAYRAHAEALDRAWWEEEAALQKGDKDSGIATEQDWKAYLDEQGVWAGDQLTPVLVRGGLSEVHLPTRLQSSSYFPAPRHRVLRGTWFAEKAPGDWVPLKESLAEQLEEGYRQQLWLPGRMSGKPGSSPVPVSGGRPTRAGAAEETLKGGKLELNTRVDRGLHALYAAPGEMYLCPSGTMAWITKRLGSEGRMRLRRGYVPPTQARGILEKEADLKAEAADAAASSTPVSHLILAVHGIGQTLSSASISTDTSTFRSIVREAEADLYPVGVAGRVEVLPVQWRRILDLRVDEVARGLIPPGLAALRQVLHATVVEVLLFLTPGYRDQMVAALVRALNAQITRFRDRNPGFKGKVSIMAHSLGSVLSYDVLCNQAAAAGAPGPESYLLTPPSPTTEIEELRKEVARLHALLSKQHQQGSDGAGTAVAVPALLFDVDCLILLGSPLPVFLAMRGINPEEGRGLGSLAAGDIQCSAPGQPHTWDGLPRARRLFNLYHPYDPVGHRLEPLAFGLEGAPGRALYVPLFRGSKRLHIGIQEFGEDMSSAASRLGASLLSSLSFGGGRGPGPMPASAGMGREGSGASLALLDRAASPDGGAGELEAIDSEPSLTFGSASGQGAALALGGSPSPPGAGRAPALRPRSPARSFPTQAPSPASPGPATAAPAAAEPNAEGARARVAAVAGGEPMAGARVGRGRLDFALQESTLSSQYLSALSAHFIYWASPDVAQFVLRATHGADVLTGEAGEGRGGGAPGSVRLVPRASPAI